MLAPHPAIPYEMRGIAQMKGGPITQPSLDDIKKVLAKYDMTFGPDKEVISVAAYLSNHYLMTGEIPNALNSLKILYNLTRDEKIKEIILRYEPDATTVTQDGIQVAPGKDAEGGKPNITRTVNENPEK
jgi:preprotein translocase subunit Sec63